MSFFSQKSKKRMNHDSKYGFGGSKRFGRQNDRGSHWDPHEDGYNPGRNKTPFAGMKKKKGGSKRPGKDQRAKNKQQRR